MIKRPLLAAFILCIFAAALGRYGAALAAVPFCCALSAAYGFAYQGRAAQRIAAGVLVLALSVLTGFIAQSHVKTPDAPLNIHKTYEARVLGVSETRSGNTKAIAMMDIEGAGKRRVMLYFNAKTALRAGEVISAAGEPESLSFPRNPGAYDEFTYLRSRRVYFKMFLKDYELTGKFFSPLAALYNTRISAAARIDGLYPKDGAGIMRAMLLGDTTALDDDISRLYSDTGIYHILAISGMHVSLMGLLINRLLRELGRLLSFISERIKLAKLNRASFYINKAAPILAVLAMFTYTAFTGLGAATVRSVIMASVVVLGGLFTRTSDFYSRVSLAGVLLLVYEPLYVFDVGFIYSFAAVTGLVLLAKPSERLFERLFGVLLKEKGKGGALKFANKYLAYCIAAFASTVPVTVWFFYKISLISILVNAVVLPSSAITLVCGFVSFIFPPAAYVTYGNLKFYEAVCELSVRVPFGVILTGRPHIAAMVFLIAAAVLWGCLPGSRDSGMRKRFIKPAAVAFSLFLSAVIYIGARACDSKSLNVTMLDVGQGDSTAFSLNGKTMFIDGGGNFMKPIGDNTGRWTVLPYLDYMGVKRADAAVLTHMDADHALGIVELLRAGRVKRLFLGDVIYPEEEKETFGEYSDFGLYKLVMGAAADTNTPISYLKEGDALMFAGEVSLDVLNPPKDMGGRTNDQSLVIKLAYNNASMLFTGDAEGRTERRLVGEYGGALNVDVLKVGHHGSKTSSTEEFVEAVSPAAAIIGVSAKNNYGHPNPAVTSRLSAGGARIFTTAGNGAVTIRVKGDTVRIRTMGE